MVSGPATPELGHVAQDRDAAAGLGPRPEQGQRRPHRDRVRVVAVVDEDAAAREREFLAPPAREDDLARPPADVREREAERAVDREGDERVVDVMEALEVELDVDALVGEIDLEPRRPLARLEPHQANVAVAADPDDVDAVEPQVRLELGGHGGDHRGPTRR